jgi:hypothetical protein
MAIVPHMTVGGLSAEGNELLGVFIAACPVTGRIKRLKRTALFYGLTRP